MQTVTVKQFFTTNTILFVAFLVGQIVFGGVSFFINSNNPLAYNMEELYLKFAIFAIIWGLGARTILIKAFAKKINHATNLEDKLKAFRSSFLVRCAVQEGANLFVIVTFFLTNNGYCLALAAIGIILFLINIPSKEKLIKELNLDYKEQEIINQGENVLNL